MRLPLYDLSGEGIVSPSVGLQKDTAFWSLVMVGQVHEVIACNHQWCIYSHEFGECHLALI